MDVRFQDVGNLVVNKEYANGFCEILGKMNANICLLKDKYRPIWFRKEGEQEAEYTIAEYDIPYSTHSQIRDVLSFHFGNFFKAGSSLEYVTDGETYRVCFTEDEVKIFKGDKEIEYEEIPEDAYDDYFDVVVIRR